ncbi:hypothetical protein [Sulfurimonas sp. NWX367]|uniref:hypothetical protein n=1 Tax=unclassified Sulfurimonas TaxID=2623549 RepID=UPI003204C296
MSLELQVNTQKHCAQQIDSEYVGLCIDDVLALAKRAKESDKQAFFVKNDLETFKSLMQSFVNKNNQKAEEALLHQEENISDIMVSFAKNEQNLMDLYKYLLLQYQNLIEEDLSLQEYQPVLYFDNYFVDFEENLEDIREQTVPNPTTHSYYHKLYKTTQDKLSIVYRVHLKNRQKYQEEYIDDRYKITPLNADKKRYLLEAEILLDEFKQYGEIFLQQLNASSAEKEKFEKDLTRLRERFEIQ